MILLLSSLIVTSKGSTAAGMDHRHAKESTHVVAVFADDTHESENDQGDHAVVLKKKRSDAIAFAAMISNINSNDPNAGFAAMGFLDILRESATLLRSNSSLFMWIMLLLICPLSALLLSGSLLHNQMAVTLSSHLYSLASKGNLLHSSLYQSLHSTLTQAFLVHILSSPIFFTLWLIAKAFILFTVSTTYSSRKPSLPMFSSIAFKLWRRLCYTHICIDVLFLTFFSISIITLVLMINFVTALELPKDLIFLLEMGLGLIYSVVFAHLIIVGDLGTVVCILEDNYGMAALQRALQLIRGRTQLALVLFLVTSVCAAMVESLYQYRVIGVPEGSYVIDTASRMWEGPLLVFMYSFLLLLDAVMGCVFYYTCKSADHDNIKEASCDHISIDGLALTDQ